MTTRFKPRQAVKEALKARLALAGPAGAGKTYTALEIAREMGQRVVVIDTEHGRSNLYADLFDFDVVEWHPPFDPRELAVAVSEAGESGYDVLVVDSLSHFWAAEGGTLDIVDAAGQQARGNKFAGWKTGTPAQESMVESILQSSLHVIVTMRSKVEYVQEGKEIRKVGLQPVQRDGIEYEFDVTCDIDTQTHDMVVDKTRCHLLAGKRYRTGEAASMAKTLSDWLDAGVKLVAPGQVDELRGLFAGLGRDDRAEAKRAFVDAFGAPERLPADRFDEAKRWVSSWSPAVAPPDDEQASLLGAGQ